jgi:hypothetical protein
MLDAGYETLPERGIMLFYPLSGCRYERGGTRGSDTQPFQD